MLGSYTFKNIRNIHMSDVMNAGPGSQVEVVADNIKISALSKEIATLQSDLRNKLIQFKQKFVDPCLVAPGMCDDLIDQAGQISEQQKKLRSLNMKGEAAS
jgi:hypothetical protein